MMWRNEGGRKWLFNSAGGGESCNVTARVERAPLCPDPRFSSSSWYRRTCVTMMFQIKRHVTRLLLLPDDAARTNQKEGNELSRRPSICDDDPAIVEKSATCLSKCIKESGSQYSSFHLFSVLVSAKAAHHLSCDTSFLRSAFRHDDRSLPRNQGCHVTYYTLLDRINKALLYNNNNPIRVLQYKSK